MQYLMKVSKIPGLMLALLLSVTIGVAQAQQADQRPEQMIRQSVDTLMSKIEGRKDYFASHPDDLEEIVDDSLENIADFRYIGASVMGKYFKHASPEQRTRFAKVFRQTLIDTYARGLVTFDYQDLNVLDNQQDSRYEDRASVDMEVVASDGKVYPVSYSLRLENGEWKVVNVIVNGINLGLTFRNQFDQAMRSQNRDFDAVISQWAPEVGVDELEEGGSS